MAEVDVLNASWDTLQRIINQPQTNEYRSNSYNNNENFDNFFASRIPSFQDLWEYKPHEKIIKEEKEDSLLEILFSPSDSVSINESMSPTQFNSEDNYIPFQNYPQIKMEDPEVEIPKKVRIKRTAPIKPIEKKQFIPVSISKKDINSAKENKQNVLTKKNVTQQVKKKESVKGIWWNNLCQITEKEMIPSKRCLYKFQNPDNCPWINISKEGLYIFEIHLLQLLTPNEAWNFKRYVDNHSKKAGEGQTFTLCSSIHNNEWEMLQMKSNKFFKKARMININAFKKKNGFITKGKWKYIYDIYESKFENLIFNSEMIDD